jgi:hypoxanthine-DNA glycosylase
MTDQAFELVADAQCRLLVLGSFPGTRSLAEQRYYAHPRNQFWQLMSPVADIDLVSLVYRDRLDALVARGIGLWDVVATARRAGSLDSALRAVAPRDLDALSARLPLLRAMAFNGAAAFTIGQRQLHRRSAVALVQLPSSSAAYTLPIAAKLAEWRKLAQWL